MNFTTRGDYGLKAMVQLALSDGQGPVSLRVIAERQDLSEAYLEQLAGPLRKAGLIRSVRGAHGGYMLDRPAEAITVAEILTVLEGPLAPFECAGEDADPEEHCESGVDYAAREVWVAVRDSVREALAATTLADLRDTARKRDDDDRLMYYI